MDVEHPYKLSCRSYRWYLFPMNPHVCLLVVRLVGLPFFLNCRESLKKKKTSRISMTMRIDATGVTITWKWLRELDRFPHQKINKWGGEENESRGGEQKRTIRAAPKKGQEAIVAWFVRTTQYRTIKPLPAPSPRCGPLPSPSPPAATTPRPPQPLPPTYCQSIF